MTHHGHTLATYWTHIGALDRSQAESAWGWFLERYRGFVHDVLCRFVGRARAEAATDEFWAYLFASNALQRADRSRRLRSYLIGVLRNFAHDWLRRQRTPAVSPTDVAAPATSDPTEDEELALWARSVLRNALADMERRWPNSAEVVRLFYGLSSDAEAGEPLSVTATAERLGCNTNAVHQALHRGRKRLRRCLEAELELLVGADGVADEIPLLLAAIGRQSPGVTDG